MAKTEVFIQNDIPNIQTIIVNEVKTIPNFDVNLLNRQLQEQLAHLINGNKVNNDNIQSPKCTKFCRSRSTYCTSGSHWIHYRCEKMTKDQITQREESDHKDENYTCKRCIQTPGLRQIEYININEETMAKSILIDEDNSQTDETIQVDDDQPQNQCFICNNIATSDEGDTCVICDKWCHTICMDSNVDDPTCEACKALFIQNQQLMLNTTTINEMSQPIDSQTVQTNRARGDTGTQHPNERQNPATNEKDSTARTKDVKLCELRTKELKLKKMEEQIKQREKSAQETNNNRTKLESRCQELETTNYELEQTVKTLIRRIDSIEYINNDEKYKQKSKIDNNIISDEEKMSDYFNHIFMRLHRKMTDLVFDKIEKQIDNTLEVNSENDVKRETTNSNSVLKQQHQNERSDNQQSTVGENPSTRRNHQPVTSRLRS